MKPSRMDTVINNGVVAHVPYVLVHAHPSLGILEKSYVQLGSLGVYAIIGIAQKVPPIGNGTS